MAYEKDLFSWIRSSVIGQNPVGVSPFWNSSISLAPRVWVKRDFDINPYSFALNTSRTLDPDEYYVRNYAPFNIFHELENNNMDLNVVDMRFQAEAKWKIIPKVEVTALGAYKYSTTTQTHTVEDYSNQAWAFRAMDEIGRASCRERV